MYIWQPFEARIIGNAHLNCENPERKVLMRYCKFGARLHLRLPQSRSVTIGKLCITGSKVIHHKVWSVGWLVRQLVAFWIDFFSCFYGGHILRKLIFQILHIEAKKQSMIFCEEFVGPNPNNTLLG